MAYGMGDLGATIALHTMYDALAPRTSTGASYPSTTTPKPVSSLPAPVLAQPKPSINVAPIRPAVDVVYTTGLPTRAVPVPTPVPAVVTDMAVTGGGPTAPTYPPVTPGPSGGGMVSFDASTTPDMDVVVQAGTSWLVPVGLGLVVLLLATSKRKRR